MPFQASYETFTWLCNLARRRRNIRLDRPEITALQQRRFTSLIQWANEKSPYYRDLIRRNGIDPTDCTPRDFPVLTKSELMENFDRIVTNPEITKQRIADFLERSDDPHELMDGKYYVLHTSGTSGKVCYVVYSKRDWIHGCSPNTHLMKPGWRKRIAYVAATRGHFAGVSMAVTANRGVNGFLYDLRPIDTNLPLPRIVRELNEFQPRVLCGYTTMLKILGEARRRGDLRIEPKVVCCGGEPVSPADRAVLKETFGVPVANIYAAAETLYMGIQFPEEEGISLFEDQVIFDIDSDHTRVTNLFNYTLPIVNYRMNDVLDVDEAAAPEDGYRKLHAVLGRTENPLEFENRFGQPDFIHPLVIVELCIRGLTGWQVVLHDSTSFTIRVQFEPGLNEVEKGAARGDLRAQLEALLAEKDMDNVGFEIREVDELGIDARTGKFRLVVREPARLIAVPV